VTPLYYAGQVMGYVIIAAIAAYLIYRAYRSRKGGKA
jgi:hypothetical protein